MLTVFTPTYNRGYILSRLYNRLLKQTNNDDVMQYLKHQDNDYLQTIIKQNQEIIELLKTSNERSENNG